MEAAEDEEARARAALTKLSTLIKVPAASPGNIASQLPETLRGATVFAVTVTTGEEPVATYAEASAHGCPFYAFYYSTPELQNRPLDSVVYVACDKKNVTKLGGPPRGVLHAANWLRYVANDTTTGYTRADSLDGEYVWVLATEDKLPFGKLVSA